MDVLGGRNITIVGAGRVGNALGAALFVWYQLLEKPRRPGSRDSQRGSLLGPAFSSDAIVAFLRGVDATHLFGKIRGEQSNKLGAELMTRREVSGLGINSERREPLRRAQFDFDLAPLAIMCAVARLVSNNILVA